MSNVAQIDANDKPTWLAYNETTDSVETVYVDPSTNALFLFGIAADANVPTALNTAKIDANDKPTELGYDETSGLSEALRCGSGGELLVTIVS